MFVVLFNLNSEIIEFFHELRQLLHNYSGYTAFLDTEPLPWLLLLGMEVYLPSFFRTCAKQRGKTGVNIFFGIANCNEIACVSHNQPGFSLDKLD